MQSFKTSYETRGAPCLALPLEGAFPRRLSYHGCSELIIHISEKGTDKLCRDAGNLQGKQARKNENK